MSLVEKIRKARESVVELGGFKFTLRRPTALEVIEIRVSDQGRGRAVLPYVIGWEGVTTLALGLPGGDSHPLAFDPTVRDEWLTDRLDLLQPLADAVFAAVAAHEATLEDAKKN
jgi:hypothetical protein